MLKNKTIEHREHHSDKTMSGGHNRIVAKNHESRANKLPAEQLKEIAKRCYTKYTSPFDKISDCA